jgi:glycerophosphoryl diester phosphodiesterase
VKHTRIAHRGFAAVAEENSIAAIRGALARGCDMVEVDVRRAADGALVLRHGRHDPPGGPLLSEALELISATGRGVMVDLKEPSTAAEVSDLLERFAVAIPTVVSGLPGEAREVKSRLPSVLAGRTWPNRNAQGVPVVENIVGGINSRVLLSRLDELMDGFDLLVAFHRVLTRVVVSRCHDAGRQVFAWTVDHPTRVELLRSIGVDGVISDDPSALGL